MAKSSKSEVWARRLAACERSGLSRRAWCERAGVNVHTLDYWRYRLRPGPAKSARSRSKALVPILVRDTSTAMTGIEVELSSGVRIRASTSTDVRWLASLVRELGAC